MTSLEKRAPWSHIAKAFRASIISVNLALALARQGASVGLLNGNTYLPYSACERTISLKYYFSRLA
jgi:hypothetical protein